MVEFPIFNKSMLDPKQRELWDELTLGPRGFYTGGPETQRLPDLYNAWLNFPEFGQLILKLGDALRARTELPGKLRELVVLTTSARLGARVEFDFHVPFARNEGLASPIIAALSEGRPPDFTDPAERVVYLANEQLLRNATLTEEVKAELIATLGFPGTVQFIAAVTLYVVTAYTTNIARVKLAENFSADPEELKNFFAGKK